MGVVPFHAVAIHIQHAALMPEGEIARNLAGIRNHHRCPGVGQHIVGGVALLAVQVGLAAAAHIEKNTIIPLALDVQITLAHLAPFVHVASRPGERGVNLHILTNHIAGVVELVAAIPAGGNIEAGAFLTCPQDKLSIADTQVNCGIQHDFRLFCLCFENQVLRLKQIGISQAFPALCIGGGIQVLIIIGIPVCGILQAGKIAPGADVGTHPHKARQLDPIGICHPAGTGFCAYLMIGVNSGFDFLSGGRYFTDAELCGFCRCAHHFIILALLAADVIDGAFVPGFSTLAIRRSCYEFILLCCRIINEGGAAGIACIDAERQGLIAWFGSCAIVRGIRDQGHL